MNSTGSFSGNRDNNLGTMNYSNDNNNKHNNNGGSKIHINDYNNHYNRNSNNINNSGSNNNNINSYNNSYYYDKCQNFNYINNLLPVITVDVNATTALKSYTDRKSVV